tara:strand:+ start:102 stop:1724 length:1623 start_codon:yes stop_codon:yes gene_type:complete
MRKVVFIADFFVETVTGGGELNNEVLIEDLRDQKIKVNKIQSHVVTSDFLHAHSDHFFIVSNFIGLSFECRRILMDFDYIIYEHDHKYLKTRNPAFYKDFKAPLRDVVNYGFYKNAKSILCQSNFHKSIVEKNLELDNVINLGGNLWSSKSLNILRHMSLEKKEKRCSVMKSSIEHKNTQGATEHCRQSALDYELVSDPVYESFLSKLGKNEKLVFLPQTPETLSRVVVEARMMGMSVITNNLVGATSEPWFKLKGPLLIDFMADKRKEIVEKVKELYSEIRLPLIKNPEITIMSTFNDGTPYLEPFLKDITRQTIFDKCELFFVDAASAGNEKEIIEKYMKKYDNIIYHRIEKNASVTECMNFIIKMSNGKYLTYGNIDDRRKDNCLEVLYGALLANKDLGLVYGDIYQTDVPNEVFEKNSSNKLLSDHSRDSYSKENMIKCLPGPIPLWKKELHERSGFFDQDGCDYADDWEMWLRAVNEGSIFEKVDDVVGLYFSDGRSQEENNIKQRKEEARIFYKYSHIFGTNFSKYKPYFDQYL